MRIKKDSLPLVLYIMLTAGYVLLINIGGIALPLYAYVVLCLPMISFSYEDLICQLMFLIPIASSIPYHLVYPIILILLFVKRGETRISPRQFFIPIIIIIYEIAHWFMISEMPAPMHMLSYCIVIFFVFYLTNEERMRLNMERIITYYIVGTLFLCLLLWIDGIISGHLFDIIFSGTRLGNSGVMDYANNLNNYAYYIIMGLACSVMFLISRMIERESYRKYLLLSLSYGITGWFVYSRAFTLCLILLIFITLMYLTISRRIRKRYLFTFLGVIVLLSLTLIYNPRLLETIITRFQVGNSRGNTRFEILIYYFNWFANSGFKKWIGVGAVSLQYVLGAFSATNRMNSMHNGLQQILICYGYIGFVFFLVSLIVSVVKSTNKQRIYIFYFFPLMLMIAFVQSIQFLYPYELMMPFIVSCFCVKYGADQSLKKEEEENDYG